MKTLGQSNENGGYIVELSNAEYRTLAALSQVVDGMPINWYEVHSMQANSIELDRAFIAVREYVITLDLVNQLATKIDEMKDLLGSKPEKHETVGFYVERT